MFFSSSFSCLLFLCSGAAVCVVDCIAIRFPNRTLCIYAFAFEQETLISQCARLLPCFVSFRQNRKENSSQQYLLSLGPASKAHTHKLFMNLALLIDVLFFICFVSYFCRLFFFSCCALLFFFLSISFRFDVVFVPTAICCLVAVNLK